MLSVVWRRRISGSSHASSSHEASLEPTTKRREDLGKHNVHTHFPKDRNCEICKRTKITRAPCRRRKGEAVPRADNFGDLITADHKVLSDNCESRNNHRYAVVVQDLATQWIQAYPCKSKTSQETQRTLQKLLEPESFTLTIPWNSENLVKIFHGIIARPPRGTGRQSSPWKCAQGNTGENGQNSGEVGGSSAWARPSTPECGDTLKALAGDQHPIQGGDRPRRRLRPGSLSTGSPAGRTPPHGDGSMYSQANVRVESVLRPPPERCHP